MAPALGNESQRGLLIAFDGIDSSGKETQSRLLVERLRYQGHKVHQFTTPDYSTATGQEIKQRLQNKLGCWEDTPWHEKMDLFARNRAEHRDEVVSALMANEIVIYDRYVPSSLAFFTIDALLPQEVDLKRSEIQNQISQTEYQQYDMPSENISIFLDLSPREADQLLHVRKSTNQDADEVTDQLNIQERLYNEYDVLCTQNPTKFLRVKCVSGNQLLSIEAISELIWAGLLARFPQLHI